MNIREADALIDGVRRLDQVILSQVFDGLFPDLYRYISFRTGTPEVSGKIAGRVFSDLLETMNLRAEPDHNLAGWLFEACAYRVQAYLDSQAYGLSDLRARSISSDRDAHSGFQSLGWTDNRMQQIFQQLLPEHQHILALRFSNKFSIEEIALLLEKSPFHVKEFQYQALKALQNALSARVK